MKKTAKRPADVLLTVPEVSERLNCHPATIRRWLDSGVLKGTKLAGTAWRIPESEISRLIDAGQNRPPDNPARTAPERLIPDVIYDAPDAGR